jgi:hypothetical protein
MTATEWRVQIDRSMLLRFTCLRHCGTMAVLLLLPAVTFAAQPLFDPVATRRMQAFYEVYTGRQLTAEEVRTVDQEFSAGHARNGKSREAIRALAWEFGLHMILLREEKDRAAALSLRHRLIEANYFRPQMQDTLELRLLTEPDSVRVTDVRSGRLMTQRDVIALANLWHFAKTTADPSHRELSPRQVDELVSLLNQGVNDSRGRLPQFFGDAAAYWAGVRQMWPYLNSEQKRFARTYARDTWRVHMPVELYAALWGIDRASASRRWSADVATRIRGREETIQGMARLQSAVAAMFAR